MNTLSYPSSQRSPWKVALFLTLAFWLSISLMLDGIVMPSLYVSGMMTSPDFATAGYSLFWIFNRVELLCAAVIFTSVLMSRYVCHPFYRPGFLSIILSVVLLTISLIDTYGLTPQMGALGISLNWLNPSTEISVEMNQLHAGYWLLEMLKIAASAALLWTYIRWSVIVTQD
ncbi:hypothetical protein JOY44_18515 [Phormidium sp. CLA17]|uniref:DUF4149 domain-containing protein n=1 Tax=Leptolyngbya sp. Cla-17 TaxID=2803751 RepID=UPI001491C3A3|nr:hypothetical protein [Leptolyngbya sp. Cla-17]MBM0743582.1 hypothetical protein [Leptolyngbya sp. Cla-17]